LSRAENWSAPALTLSVMLLAVCVGSDALSSVIA
jgi:hypothetical protein